MNRIAAVLAVLGSLWAVAHGSASAADVVRTENVEARLIADVGAVVPGKTFRVALRLDIREGWHTYWKNPGDSGEPTSIAWTLPDGFTASDIAWPPPRRLPVGPLVNYGYEGEALHLVRMTAPPDLAPGGTVTLRGEAYWLVCEDICIPEEATLELALPVAESGPPPASQWQDEITAAEQSLPTPSPWPATYEISDDGLTLRIAASGLDDGRIETLTFFPAQYGVIDHAAAQDVAIDSDGVTVSAPRSPYAEPVAAPLEGVVVIKEGLDGGTVSQAFAVSAEEGAPSEAAAGFLTLPRALLFAFLGGLILILMPCVLPVLFMKGMGLVRHAHAPPTEIRSQGMAFTAGVLVTFGVLAGVLIALQAAGERIGWGFQLQSPVFVALLAYLMFTVGLALSGVLTVGGGLTGAGSALAEKPGNAGAFFTGALATVVATPCTAPFMAAALGFALTRPWFESLLVFEALGLGLAVPYLALSFSPRLLRFLPKPGPWMDRLKQFLAFPMYATAAWLVWVLGRQIGADGVLVALAGMILIALAAWLKDATDRARHRVRLAGMSASVVIAAGAVALAAVGTDVGASMSRAESEADDVEPFSRARVAELRAAGTPVFVNFTADWCITCKVNERVALDTPAVEKAFAEKKIAYLKGDWTNRDAEIADVLESFGRQGVPLYVLYPGDPARAPIVLPQILTQAGILEQLGRL